MVCNFWLIQPAVFLAGRSLMIRALLLPLLALAAMLGSSDVAHATCGGGNFCATDGTHGTKIDLSWNDPADYLDYILYRKLGVSDTCPPTQPGCSGWTQIYQTYNQVAGYSDTAPQSGQMYQYWLCYRVTSGGNTICPQTGPAGNRRVTAWRAPPPIPTNVTTTDGTETAHLRVSWSGDTQFSPSSYTLFRATTPHNCESGGSTLLSGISAASHNDVSATPGVTYFYSVKRVATNGGGSSACLTEGGGGWRKMSPPTNVVASATAPLQVTVNWNHPSASGAPSNGVVTYRVYRRQGSSSSVCSSGQQVGTVNGSSPVFTDTSSTGLIPGQNYYYAIRSEGQNGTLSDCSNANTSGANPPGYSISGGVFKDIGGGLQGAAVSIGTANTTTSASGTFSFTGLNNGNYTVTASKAGVLISPVSIPAFISGASVSGVTFTASCPAGQQFSGSSCVAITYSLAGTVRNSQGQGLSGVTINGGALGNRTTNASGSYSYTSIAHGTQYNLNPSLSSYTFSPSSVSGTLTSNFTNADFTGTLLPPNPPTGVSASDGTSAASVSVSWGHAGPAASSFTVLRDGSPIGTPSSSPFSDTSATPGVTYQYSVSATNAGGTSAPSSSNSGYRALAQTSGLNASALSPSSISLAWNLTNHANTYHVWKNGSCSGSAEQVVTAPPAIFTGLSFGTHTFSVKAVGENGLIASGTPCSAPASIELVPEAPGSPLSLWASDGSFSDKVRVTWSAASGTVTEYRVFRTANCQGAPVGTSTGTQFDDSTAPRGVVFTYSARAMNETTPGPCSNNDDGFAALIPPGPITSISASDGTSTSAVSVVWDAPASGDAPSSYLIYRNDDTCSGAPLQTVDATNTTVEDSSAIAGVNHHFRIRAVNAGGQGPCGTGDLGFKALAAVSGVTASAELNSSATVSWNPLLGASEYRVYRSANCTSDFTASVSDSVLVSNLPLDQLITFSVKAAGVNGAFASATPCSNVASLTLASATLTVQATISSQAAPAVEVFLNGASRGTTNAAGLLQITGLTAGGYTISAARPNTAFSPTQQQRTLTYGDQVAVSFEAACSPGFEVQNGICEPIPAQPIELYVNCVHQLGETSYRAYFGYDNPNGTVSIPVGTEGINRNFFSTGAVAQGQVTEFLAGIRRGEFSVPFDGSDLTWNVEYQGKGLRSVTANAASLACAPVIPEARCISINPLGQIVARFGYQNPNELTTPLHLPVGPLNRIIPAPDDQGQPTDFLYGTIASAFEVPLVNGSVAWSLNGIDAQATIADEVCAPGNNAPVASSGGPYSENCQGSLTNVQLNASASFDPDGNPLRYSWTTTCAEAIINNPTSAQPVLTLLKPGMGQSVSCAVTVTATDGLLSSMSQSTVAVTACALDCLGNPNGSAQIDACGVCGGNGTSCLDCQGVPFGTKTIDQCGVCGGTNMCLDCAGTPNGSAGPDRCGVCAGDGTSCLGCVETNLSDLITFLTRDFFTLRDINARALRRLKPIGGVRLSKRTLSQLKKIDFRYNQFQLDLYANLPPTVVSCTNAELCVQKDNSEILDRYSIIADEFLTGTRKATRRLPRFRTVTRTDKKRVKRAQKVHTRVKAQLLAVPRVVSSCE